jgi:hypothetical protein
VGLVLHAANDTESQVISAAMPALVAEFRTGWGINMGYFIYRQDQTPGKPAYRPWLARQINKGFDGLDFCAQSYVVSLGYDDLASMEIRDKVEPLEAFFALAPGRDTEFLDRAWEQLKMTQSGGSAAAQLAAPWLREGCSESFQNLAIIAPPLSTNIGTAWVLLDYLLAEEQQIEVYAPQTVSVQGASVAGFRMGFPTLKRLYQPGGQPDDQSFPPIACQTTPIAERPNPDQVAEAIAVAEASEAIFQLLRERRMNTSDYSFGIDTQNAVFVSDDGGGAVGVRALDRDQNQNPDQNQQASTQPLSIVAAGERLKEAFTTESLAAQAAREQLGVSVGILALYDADTPPLGTPNPPLQRPSPLIFLPGVLRSDTFSPWSDNYHQLLVTLRPSADASGFETVLLDPSGRPANLETLRRNLGVSLFELDPVVIEEVPSASVDVWAEEGSKKICFKVDKRKLCIRLGR